MRGIRLRPPAGSDNWAWPQHILEALVSHCTVDITGLISWQWANEELKTAVFRVTNLEVTASRVTNLEIATSHVTNLEVAASWVRVELETAVSHVIGDSEAAVSQSDCGRRLQSPIWLSQGNIIALCNTAKQTRKWAPPSGRDGRNVGHVDGSGLSASNS